jgi:uncharacterized protein YgiM (DUF1202 family)
VAYDVAGIVQPGAVYDALAYAVDTDGDVWYLIRLESGVEAWISEWVSVLRENVNLARIAIAATVPPLPSATPSLTRTPTLPPTVTLTFLPQPTARTSEEYGVNLRSGAGTEYARLETLPPDTPLQLVGRTADMTWVQVTTPGGRQGWIMAHRGDPCRQRERSLPCGAVSNHHAAGAPDLPARPAVGQPAQCPAVDRGQREYRGQFPALVRQW